jgi:glycosyltransferase involved in cell wall biosynthesis
MTDLSVIVPTYNAKSHSEATVATLHSELETAGLPAEIILVDDGSRPEERPDPFAVPHTVRVVQLDRNRGKGFAVRVGLGAAAGRVRIFTDVDLPYGTASVIKCYERLNRGGIDVVYGDRSLPESTRLSRTRKRRRVSSVVFRAVVSAVAGLRQADTQCGIKGMRGPVAAAMLPVLTVDGFAFDVEVFRCAEDNGLVTAPIAVNLTNGDNSTVRLIRDSAHMLRDLVAIRARSRRGEYQLREIKPPLTEDARIVYHKV